MSYLHQVIYLTTVTNNSSTKFSTINTSTGSYFYTVSNNYIADMRYFDKSFTVTTWSEAKTICTNGNIRMNNTITSNDTSFSNYSSRPNSCVIPDCGIV